MSEAVSDLPSISGYRHFEARSLANLITGWFEQVAVVVPPEKYKNLEPGKTEQLLKAPGIGEIAIRYEGSRPTSKSEFESNTSVPLQRCAYSLFMSDDSIERFPRESEPLGWWMPLHMEYGPKLVVDQPAAAEELLGSTSETRQRLESLLLELTRAYIAPDAAILAIKP